MEPATSEAPATGHCPYCGGTGKAPAGLKPQAIRLLDAKSRITIPFPLECEYFQPYLCGCVIRYVADPGGTYALCPAYPDGPGRLTLPADFRQVLGLRPGDDVAISREGQDLLVWAWRES